ncbi:MAG: ABC transporter permease subunit [Pseudomonadales bacterium]|nr:ABC transporter permease subunit [Pseudomonadales bacterium]MBO6704178.1 ABC transporter permease subunit [Pseudomonadales bacterium]MBO7006015.1 ABC transporter permease subunit [Pseudomonadales bacterium]
MNIGVVLKRELSGYFATPVAYVFIFIFLVLAGVFTFYVGNFYERQQADLVPFFSFHPWLYLFLIPAISMRLWSEERKSGTLELLMTLPLSRWDIVLGKFLAAWLFAGIALVLTFPIWLTVNFLGHPDNGVILASYIGSWLMAGGFLAIGSCMSALTRSQVVAFVLCGFVTLMFVMAGFPLVLDIVRGWLPLSLVDVIASLSFLTHFNAISRGVLSLQDFLYFISMILAWLFATSIVLDLKKGG